MTFAICLIALAAGSIHLRYREQRAVEIALTATLALTTSISGWNYYHSNLNLLADGKRTQVHSHDFTHYYLGGKYFPELGYQGLYVGIAAGLQDLRTSGQLPATELTRVEAIRDLAEKTRGVSATDLATQSALLRKSFTAQRWRSFIGDIGYLARLRPDFDWRVFVLDSGFNPSPAWTVLGYTIANLAPLDQSFHLLLGIDRVLVLIVGLALWWFVGAVPALFGATMFFVFPPGYFSTGIWTDGSFLRLSWLVWLAFSWILLQRGRFFPSGLLLGIATLERLFPIFFFAGALWSFAGKAGILSSFRRAEPDPPAVDPSEARAAGDRRRVRRNAISLLAGFACGVLALGTLSTAVFGPKSWFAFGEHITAHSTLYYMNHLGLQKAGTYSPELTTYASSINAPDLFRNWSSALSLRWKRWRTNLIVQVLLVLAALAAGGRLSRVGSSAFIGSALLFALSMPAHYYLAYFSLWGAFLLIPDDGTPTGSQQTAPQRHRVMYLCFAAMVLVIEALLLAPLPQLQAIAYCCFTLIFFFIGTSAALLFRPRAAVLTCCSLLAAGALILPARAAPLSNLMPPPEIAEIGERLSFELAAPDRFAALKSMDSFGYTVDDTGFPLAFGDVVTSRFSATRGEAVNLVLRSNLAAQGYLGVNVNGRWRSTTWVRQQGTLGYLQIKVPPEALVPGANVVEVSWSGARPLTLFSSWVVRPGTAAR